MENSNGETRVPSLNELVGTNLIGRIPFLRTGMDINIKIHRVETSGLWIESQDLTDAALSLFGVTSAQRTVVLFVPFYQIQYLVYALDVPSISDKAISGE